MPMFLFFLFTENPSNFGWLIYPHPPATVGRFLPPATKLGQGYVFTGVCDSVHRGGVCLTACWDATPPEQTPPSILGADTHPWSRHPLPRRACWEIRSMHGRYASYWNAILLNILIPVINPNQCFVNAP